MKAKYFQRWNRFFFHHSIREYRYAYKQNTQREKENILKLRYEEENVQTKRNDEIRMIDNKNTVEVCFHSDRLEIWKRKNKNDSIRCSTSKTNIVLWYESSFPVDHSHHLDKGKERIMTISIDGWGSTYPTRFAWWSN